MPTARESPGLLSILRSGIDKGMTCSGMHLDLDGHY